MSYIKGMGDLISTMWMTILISVPLAIWKVIDIVIWIFKHVRVRLE